MTRKTLTVSSICDRLRSGLTIVFACESPRMRSTKRFQSFTIAPAAIVAIAVFVVICCPFSADAQTQIATRLETVSPSHPLTPAIKMGHEALTAMEDVADYEAIFVKKEVIDGRLTEQKMRIRFREQPFSVHLKFLEPHEGREVLYVEGRNNNQLKVKDSSGLLALVGPVSLDPTSEMATKETVYPITEIGIRNMVERLLDHWMKETSSSDLVVKQYPNARMGDQDCLVVEATHPRRGPGTEYHKVRLYIDKDSGHPIRIQHLGFPSKGRGEAPIIGDYAYLDLKTNIGLTDRDFAFGR